MSQTNVYLGRQNEQSSKRINLPAKLSSAHLNAESI